MRLRPDDGQHPHVSGGVDVHAQHTLARPRPGQHGAELSVIEPLHAERRSHPDGSVDALGHGCHRHGGEALWFAEDRYRIALNTG